MRTKLLTVRIGDLTGYPRQKTSPCPTPRNLRFSLALIKFLVAIATVQPCFLWPLCYGQEVIPGSLDPSFNVSIEPDGSTVRAMSLQPDGRLIVGGDFRQVNTETRNGIVRLNPDGALDSTFQPVLGSNAAVTKLALQPDGKVLVAGNLPLAGEPASPSDQFMRLNSDGTRDASFSPVTDGSRGIQALAVQADGKIIVAQAYPPGMASLFRLNADGSRDSAFQKSSVSWVTSLIVQADGRVLVGGIFSEWMSPSARESRSGVLRLHPDGTLDKSFNDPLSLGSVLSLALQPDGKILAGTFACGMIEPSSCKPARPGKLVRFLPNGVQDTTFVSRTDIDGSVESIATQRSGHILIAGEFTQLEGAPRSGIARLNSDGSLDYSFDPGSGGGKSLPLRLSSKFLSVRADDDVMLSGVFDLFAGMTRGQIIRLDGGAIAAAPPLIRVAPSNQRTTTGQNVSFVVSLLSSLQPRFQWLRNGIAIPGATQSMLNLTNVTSAMEGDYMVVITNSLGTTSSPPARLDVGPAPIFPGAADPGFFHNLGQQEFVNDVAVQPDGKVLLCGGFDFVADGGLQRPVVRLLHDGQRDPSFSCPSSLPSSDSPTVGYVILMQPDSKVVVAGENDNILDFPRCRVFRLNPDGQLDDSFGVAEFSAGHHALYKQPVVALQTDGKILVGGGFNSVGGLAQTNLARLGADGAVDREFRPKVPGQVTDVAQHLDGRIIVAGISYTPDGSLRAWLVRLHLSGEPDVEFKLPAGAIFDTIYHVQLQSDGHILVALLDRLSRLNADGSEDPSFKPNVHFETEGRGAGISDIQIQKDGKILIAGAFCAGGNYELCGSSSMHGWRSVLRLNPDGSLDRSFDSGDAQRDTGGKGWAGHLALLPDQQIFVAGSSVTASFDFIGGLPRSGLARLYGGDRLVLEALQPGRLRVHGAVDTNYLVEASHNLSGWTRIGSTKGGTQLLDQDATNRPIRFYRARSE